MIESGAYNAENQRPNNTVPDMFRIPNAPGCVIEPPAVNFRPRCQGFPGGRNLFFFKPKLRGSYAPQEQEFTGILDPLIDCFLLNFFREFKRRQRLLLDFLGHGLVENDLRPFGSKRCHNPTSKGDAADNPDTVPIDVKIERLDMYGNTAWRRSANLVVKKNGRSEQQEQADSIPVWCYTLRVAQQLILLSSLLRYLSVRTLASRRCTCVGPT